MIVKSGSYVLAIPDLTHYARHETDVEAATRPETASSVSSRKQLAVFKKTIMKLNGNVQWVAGLVFERNVDDGGRSFNFIPHYKVSLKNPKYAKPSDGKVSNIADHSTQDMLTVTRSTTLSEASAVTTSICLSLSLRLTIGSGMWLTLSLPRHTTASILHLDSLRTSTVGGLCSPERCPYRSGKASCGLALKSQARSSGDIWRPSSTTYCSRPCT